MTTQIQTVLYDFKYALENTEGAINNGQSREEGKQNKNTTKYVLDINMRKNKNTNHVNKT